MYKFFGCIIIVVVACFGFTSHNNHFQNTFLDTVPKKQKAITDSDIIPPPPPPPPLKTGKVSQQKIERVDTLTDDNIIFTKVEIDPTVDQKQWVKHLQNHLVPFIKKAAKKNIPAGIYTIQVKFLVEKDGSVKDIKALNDPGYGLKEEAIKIVQTGPKWSPGIQNGRIVRSYKTQPVTFVIDVADQ